MCYLLVLLVKVALSQSKLRRITAGGCMSVILLVLRNVHCFYLSRVHIALPSLQQIQVGYDVKQLSRLLLCIAVTSSKKTVAATASPAAVAEECASFFLLKASRQYQKPMH